MTPVSTSTEAATARSLLILARCREIAACTEVPGQITRTFLSPPMHAVHRLLRGWMEAAGMHTSTDAAGNLRALLPASGGAGRRVVLASHLDTVPNAGAFDGVLGVVLALAVVEALPEPLPFAVEVIGFSEEEGVRFRRPFLGSLAVVGKLDHAALELTGDDGTSVADAIRAFGLDPTRIPEARLSPDTSAFLEMHIEQGPVLAALSAAPLRPQQRVLGVVGTIVGQSRLFVSFDGQANHAGTTPMSLRHDALAAASAWIVAVEALAHNIPGLVATVGRIEAQPGASNIVPGHVQATLDVRHAEDATRQRAVADLLASAESAASSRGVHLASSVTLDQPAVPMDPQLTAHLEEAVSRAGHWPHRMGSGAGHDAMILAPYLPSAMLFLPTPGGLSHHPDEAVLASDVEAALESALEFLRGFRHDHSATHA